MVKGNVRNRRNTGVGMPGHGSAWSGATAESCASPSLLIPPAMVHLRYLEPPITGCQVSCIRSKTWMFVLNNPLGKYESTCEGRIGRQAPA